MIKINIYISITVILISLITYYYYIFNNSHHKEPFLSYRDFLNRKCFTPKITLNERKAFLRLINITNNILKKHNIDWIPIGGNLISVYRLLKPGGVIRIDTPTNGLCAMIRPFIEKFINVMKHRGSTVNSRNGYKGFGDCRPPEHNFWFSKKAMHILLQNDNLLLTI